MQGFQYVVNDGIVSEVMTEPISEGEDGYVDGGLNERVMVDALTGEPILSKKNVKWLVLQEMIEGPDGAVMGEQYQWMLEPDDAVNIVVALTNGLSTDHRAEITKRLGPKVDVIPASALTRLH